MVPFLTLCSLSSDFGEEGNLGHSYKWQTQNLQKHPNDELSQLPWKPTYRKHRSAMEEKTVVKDDSYVRCLLWI